jgi:hypothetical protein
MHHFDAEARASPFQKKGKHIIILPLSTIGIKT